MLIAAGWTEANVRDRSWENAKELLDAARASSEIVEYAWKQIKNTWRNWRIYIECSQYV